MSRANSLLLALLFVASLPVQAQEKAKEFKPIEINGQLAETDPRDKKLDKPCKLHRVEMVKGKTYVIDLVGKGFDAYLRLEDPSGKQVAEDDDSGGNLNARITYTPDADGNFQISATTLTGDVGPYSLKVRQIDPTKVAKLELGKALDVGADGLKIDSKLDADDVKSPVNPTNPCKVYSVKMKANQKYVIDLESDAFDAYLHVLDGNLKSLAEDDDGGANLNSRLVFRAPSDGTFHILATSLNRQDGAFTLRVRPSKE